MMNYPIMMIDPGGDRILIRNSEGKVEAFFMHLNEKPNLKEGEAVKSRLQKFTELRGF